MSATVDTNGFDRMVRDLARYAPGNPVKKVIRDQTGQILSRVSRDTPPKTLAQGRKAVARDIHKAVGSVDHRQIENPRLKQAVRKGDAATAQTLMHRMGWRYHTVQRFTPAMHTRVRDRRGRVRRNQNVLALPTNAVKRYTREVQSRVGTAKASSVAIGNKLRINVKAPGWVRRNAVAARRYAQGFERQQGSRFYLELINSAPTMVHGLDGAMLFSRAIRIRLQAFNREVKKGVFQDLKTRAQRYPGIFVR